MITSRAILTLEVSNLTCFEYLRVHDKVELPPLFFYLCFENDLMNLLCACLYGFRINGLSVCCPTVADDIALISLTKYGLQQLMNICYSYSFLWRYLYNALKCAIWVFNESNSVFSRTRRQWYFGDDEVLERTSNVHLGIECNKEMNVKNSIILAFVKNSSKLLLVAKLWN